MVVKYLFFLMHLSLIFTSLLIIYPFVIILHIIVIGSWYINNNNCLLTQIENYLFGETIIDLYYNIRGTTVEYKKFHVPWYHRYVLYILFGFGILINIYNYQNHYLEI